MKSTLFKPKSKGDIEEQLVGYLVNEEKSAPDVLMYAAKAGNLMLIKLLIGKVDLRYRGARLIAEAKKSNKPNIVKYVARKVKQYKHLNPDEDRKFKVVVDTSGSMSEYKKGWVSL